MRTLKEEMRNLDRIDRQDISCFAENAHQKVVQLIEMTGHYGRGDEYFKKQGRKLERLKDHLLNIS